MCEEIWYQSPKSHSIVKTIQSMTQSPRDRKGVTVIRLYRSPHKPIIHRYIILLANSDHYKFRVLNKLGLSAWRTGEGEY